MEDPLVPLLERLLKSLLELLILQPNAILVDGIVVAFVITAKEVLRLQAVKSKQAIGEDVRLVRKILGSWRDVFNLGRAGLLLVASHIKLNGCYSGRLQSLSLDGGRFLLALLDVLALVLRAARGGGGPRFGIGRLVPEGCALPRSCSPRVSSNPVW